MKESTMYCVALSTGLAVVLAMGYVVDAVLKNWEQPSISQCCTTEIYDTGHRGHVIEIHNCKEREDGQ